MDGQYQYYQYQRQDEYQPRQDYSRPVSYDQTLEYQEAYYEGHSSPQIGRTSQKTRKKRASNRSDESATSAAYIRKRNEPSIFNRFGGGFVSYIVAPMLTGVAFGFGLRLGRTIYENMTK